MGESIYEKAAAAREQLARERSLAQAQEFAGEIPGTSRDDQYTRAAAARRATLEAQLAAAGKTFADPANMPTLANHYAAKREQELADLRAQRVANAANPRMWRGLHLPAGSKFLPTKEQVVNRNLGLEPEK